MKKKCMVYLLTAVLLASSVPAPVMAAGFEAEGVVESAEEGFAAVVPEGEEVLEQEKAAEQEAITEGEEPSEESSQQAGQSVEDLQDTDGAWEKAEVTGETPEDGMEAVEGEEASLLTASGTSGTTDWTLDSSGTLVVSGTGSTADESTYNNPGALRNYVDEVRHVIIEEGVTAIGAKTFFNFQKIETIDLPDSLRTIGDEAFCQCYALEEIYIPENVKTIGWKAFSGSGNDGWGHSAMGSIIFDEDIRDLAVESQAFWSTGARTLTVAGSNITMKDDVFESSPFLTTVTIEPGLVSTGYGLFRDCGKLTGIVIPGTVKKMSSGIFSGCESLRSLVLEEGVEEVGELLCFGCSSLTSVTLPKSLKTLPGLAFSGCTSLPAITLPEGLEIIGDRAFEYCESLKTLKMPSTLKSFGTQAFLECTSMTSIELNNGLTSMGNASFHHCSALQEIVIPGTVKEIWNVFYGCTALREVTLMDGVEEVSYRAFDGCSGLSEIHFPGSLTYIGDSAFSGCVSLAEIYFEGDAPDFSGYAFTGVVADAYYPTNASGWTADVRQNYNGRITWHGYAPELRVPVLISAANTSTGIKVSWNPVSGASGYGVWRKTGNGSWSWIGRTTNTFYNNGKVTAGTEYTYTVRAYRGSFDTANKNKYDAEYWSKYDADGVTAVRLMPGKISSVTNGASSISVKWNKVTGAKGYYVYKKTGSGSYVRIATVGSSTLSYSDKDFKNGTSYTYAVRPYNGDSRGTYTGVKTYRLSRSLISSAKRAGSGKITVKWGKNVRVTGYQISYTTGSTTKTVTVKGSGTTSKTLTGLSSGKSYTIKVRGYKTVSGKNYYSGWSTAKTVKA